MSPSIWRLLNHTLMWSRQWQNLGSRCSWLCKRPVVVSWFNLAVAAVSKSSARSPKTSLSRLQHPSQRVLKSGASRQSKLNQQCPGLTSNSLEWTCVCVKGFICKYISSRLENKVKTRRALNSTRGCERYEFDWYTSLCWSAQHVCREI